MKWVLLPGLSLLLSASVLSAQYEKPIPQDGAMTTQIVTLHPDGSVTPVGPASVPEVWCPVSMDAKQGSGGGLIAARDKNPPKATGPSQRIHLVVSDTKTAKVTGARVRVYGFSGKNRLQNAFLGPDAPDAMRTLQVSFAPEGRNQAAADLVLPGFTAVTRVVLQAIAYDDGSTWKPEGQHSCSVRPDLIMLVAGR